MSEDQSTRYRRLLVEGVVIVTSILLAFAIDALWAQRQDRSAERQALVSLESEFESNRQLIRLVIDMHIEFRETVTEFSDLAEPELQDLDQTSVSRIVLAAANPWTFDPVLGTTDALVGAGRLELIRDHELREALSTFLNLVADLTEDVGYMASASEAVWKREAELGGPWTDPATEMSTSGLIGGLSFIPKATPGDLVRLRRDESYMGLVRRYHLNAAYYVQELERLDEHMAEILSLIRRQ